MIELTKLLAVSCGLAVGLLGLPASVSAQSDRAGQGEPRVPSAATQREVLDASGVWFDALMRGDLAAMDRLQTKDFLAIQPTKEGVAVLSRDTQQQTVPAPANRPPVERQLEGVRVRQYGDVVVLTAMATVRTRGPSAPRPVSQAVITEIWVKQEDGWRLSHFQPTNVPPRVDSRK